jgi:D-alanyl-D-alanine dipeptidase
MQPVRPRLVWAYLFAAAVIPVAFGAACGRSQASPPPAPAAATPPPNSGAAGTTTAPATSPTDSDRIAPDAVAESVLVDVRSIDPSILVDLRYATPRNFTGAVLPGYEADRALLRREVAEALARVQRRLKTGDIGLRIWDAYRPVRATRAMVDWAGRSGRSDLLDQGYIARHSRHNLGVAVDLTLVDLLSGTELDLGTPFDTFSEAAHTANAQGRVRRYRELLVRAMAAEGFENLPQEWWHFSYPVPGAPAFDLVIR